ncbi:hypothetical protein GDO78_021331 [Eleutherodactylus coqui]|uniref:Uncharacterized protein n=1 Tax=Eleutherodactylus coqui TaxID=57060 RepID=A0A8J6BAK7_ELECQ|nr:hypothetical protein GDO78_021331 [Eleutherodactylus coqui]
MPRRRKLAAGKGVRRCECDSLIGGSSREEKEKKNLRRSCHQLPRKASAQTGLTSARKRPTQFFCLGVQGPPIWHGSWEPARCSCVSLRFQSPLCVIVRPAADTPVWRDISTALFTLCIKGGNQVFKPHPHSPNRFFLFSARCILLRRSPRHFLPAGFKPS